MKTYLETLKTLPKKKQIEDLKDMLRFLENDYTYDIDKEHHDERIRIIKEYKGYLKGIIR